MGLNGLNILQQYRAIFMMKPVSGSLWKWIFRCSSVTVVLLIMASFVVFDVWHQVNPVNTFTMAFTHFWPDADDLHDVRQTTHLPQLNETFLVQFLRENGIKAENGLSGRNGSELTDYEIWLLSTSSFTTMMSIPDEKMSKVTVLTPRAKLCVGNKLQVRVDLYDKLGRRHTTGGDEVRIWLTHPQSTEKNRTAVAAHVTDLSNGGYLGETTLQWAGVTLVRVSLTYPREFLWLVTRLQHSLLSLQFVTAKFRNKHAGVSETTVCLPSSPVPGFARTCNLTRENGGFPWYCGQPTDTRLTCRDWAGVSNLRDTALPLSDEEQKLVGKINGQPFLRLIPNNITLIVTDDATRRRRNTLPPCSALPSRDTWNQQAPRGWFSQGSWQPTGCSLPELTSQRVQRCMRNTSLWLLGDSNQRMWWDHIRDMMQCSYQKNRTSWYAPRLCENDHLNSTLRYSVHALPFLSSAGRDYYHIPLHHLLRQFPRERNVVIVIHYYVHATFDLLHHYRDRVRHAKEIVATFLDEQVQGQNVRSQGQSLRNQGQTPRDLGREDGQSQMQNAQRQSRKDQQSQGLTIQGQTRKEEKSHGQGQNVQGQGQKVRVVIRGPHVEYSSVIRSHVKCGDRFGQQLLRIWREEFRDLYDRVWFLDFWDMTIASENMPSHPPPAIRLQQLKVLFDYLCEQE